MCMFPKINCLIMIMNQFKYPYASKALNIHFDTYSFFTNVISINILLIIPAQLVIPIISLPLPFNQPSLIEESSR